MLTFFLYFIVLYLAIGFVFGSIVTAYNFIVYGEPHFNEGVPTIILWPGAFIGFVVDVILDWMDKR